MIKTLLLKKLPLVLLERRNDALKEKKNLQILHFLSH